MKILWRVLFILFFPIGIGGVIPVAILSIFYFLVTGNDLIAPYLDFVGKIELYLEKKSK